MTSCTQTEADIQGAIERALQVQSKKLESFLKCELPDLLVDKLAREHNIGKFNFSILESEGVPMPQVRSWNETVVRPQGDHGQDWAIEESFLEQNAFVLVQDTTDEVIVHTEPQPVTVVAQKEVTQDAEPMIFVKNMNLQVSGFGGGLWTHLSELKGGPQQCFVSFVAGPIFSVITSLAILANTIYIGWETNEKMTNELSRLQGNPYQTLDPGGEYVFVGFFITEMFMRMGAQRSLWLLGKDRYWNVFDAFLILLSFVQLVADTGSNLSVFRVFRVFRLIRLLKVVRRISYLESLKLMLYGIVSCIMPLFWAITLLLIIMYAFGVFFMSCVVGYLQDQSTALSDDLMAGLDEKWGSMYKSMCVLFEGITGGNDWAYLSQELKEIGEAYYLCYALYIVFVSLGVLNIVTGFFVDGTMQASVNQKDELLRAAQERKNTMVGMVKELFAQLDSDHSGKLSMQEFESHLYDEDLQEYFCVLEMEPEEARDLFCLLDVSNVGEVDIDQFINGCLKVMGKPSNLDICGCLLHSKRLIVMMEALLASLRSSGFKC